MLQNIENKRKRFQSKSNLFLSITLGLGIIFVTMVISFGYILLNDNALGLGRDVEKIQVELRNINKNTSVQNLYRGTEDALKDYSVNLDSIKNTLLNDTTFRNDKVISDYLEVIDNFK